MEEPKPEKKKCCGGGGCKSKKAPEIDLAEEIKHVKIEVVEDEPTLTQEDKKEKTLDPGSKKGCCNPSSEGTCCKEPEQVDKPKKKCCGGKCKSE